jgi:acetyl esterase/lipase
MWKIAPMPSRRHELLRRVVPKLRKSRELDSPEAEKTPARALARHPRPDLPDRRGPVLRPALRRGPRGAAGGLPVVHRDQARDHADRTVVYCHGGGFVGADRPFQVRYAARLASGLGAGWSCRTTR